MSLLIIINESPSSSKTWNALRLCAALIGQDEEVQVFLMNDGVFNVMNNQNPPDEIASQATSKKLFELHTLGADIFYCSQCLESRGINVNEIAPEIKKSNLPKLAIQIQEASKVISF
ncbi:DsrE family protein [bacterium]|jgi:sulfur relay (sulfurtransferase) complex TusBCD TusD component (DsrE family)|nr:DsrE family protein [bacterium]MBT3849853.1 DsrE family protein [bacterium]MBT4434772.1 DsrE family protein [bacterium]MDG2446111.1 DsrE family protein [Thermodesulfobacteriota bacterium]|tara:strand:+ start:91 stop:441 length:351 start_codon:yes stop_codon:yes gene_type:complete